MKKPHVKALLNPVVPQKGSIPWKSAFRSEKLENSPRSGRPFIHCGFLCTNAEAFYQKKIDTQKPDFPKKSRKTISLFFTKDKTGFFNPWHESCPFFVSKFNRSLFPNSNIRRVNINSKHGLCIACFTWMVFMGSIWCFSFDQDAVKLSLSVWVIVWYIYG